MSLVIRLFVIFFGFLAACVAAGMIVVGAVHTPMLRQLVLRIYPKSVDR